MPQAFANRFVGINLSNEKVQSIKLLYFKNIWLKVNSLCLTGNSKNDARECSETSIPFGNNRTLTVNLFLDKG